MIVEFDDNRLMAALCGQHDRNLARVERLLGVSLTPRGNRLMISGANAAARAARTALNQLYARLRDGDDVGPGEIDGAVRMAQAGDGEAGGADLSLRTRKRKIVPRSPNQAAYIGALTEHTLVFGIGPAGTGKTYLAVSVAVSMLLAGDVDRIILSRPAVEAGERLGFLPGDLREKVDPYLRPLYDALYDMLPAEQVVNRLVSGEIEVAPLAFMRGRTLSNSFVIVDEAQNTTPVQMKMLLTRLGENSRMVVTGDLSQIDLPGGVRSGLRDAIDVLAHVEGISFIWFTDADVVRHALVSRIVRAYDERDRSKHEADASKT